MNQPIDIIIPSYNGRHLLESHLPHVFRNSGPLGEVIVIDNGSTDNTISWLKENYPQVTLISNQKNLGFTKPVNQGVAISKARYFALLNNDVRPEKGYLEKALRFFKNEKVFAVSFNEHESSWPLVQWDGKIQFTRGEDKSFPRYSAWASGGSALFCRKIWDKLGGLNEIYAPFYWEDIDIGYRAWKMGYQVVWDNQSLVHHHHESTSRALNQKYLSLIKQRNELLFNWINISDPKLVSLHRRYLLQHSLKHPGYFKVIFSALWRYLTHKQPLRFTRRDEEVLSLVNQKYEIG